MDLVTDNKSGLRYYKIRNKSSFPEGWVNDPVEFDGFPFTGDLKGYKFPSPNPVPILASLEHVCYLFADEGGFYCWWPVAGSLEHIDALNDIEGILDRLKKGQEWQATELSGVGI